MSANICSFTGKPCEQNCRDEEPCSIQADHEGEAAYERARRRSYPARIFLEPGSGDPDGRMWCQHDVWSGDPAYAEDGPAPAYIRADLAGTVTDAMVAAALAAPQLTFKDWPDRLAELPRENMRRMLVAALEARGHD